MSKQEWSKVVPVEDGYYWLRQFNDESFLVELYQGKVYGTNALPGDQIEDFEYYEWLGPLTPPEQG